MGTTSTQKSFTKRFKTTKTGKILHRKKGQGHSRANKSRKVIRRMSGDAQVKGVDYKNISKHLK